MSTFMYNFVLSNSHSQNLFPPMSHRAITFYAGPQSCFLLFVYYKGSIILGNSPSFQNLSEHTVNVQQINSQSIITRFATSQFLVSRPHLRQGCFCDQVFDQVPDYVTRQACSSKVSGSIFSLVRSPPIDYFIDTVKDPNIVLITGPYTSMYRFVRSSDNPTLMVAQLNPFQLHLANPSSFHRPWCGRWTIRASTRPTQGVVTMTGLTGCWKASGGWPTWPRWAPTGSRPNFCGQRCRASDFEVLSSYRNETWHCRAN